MQLMFNSVNGDSLVQFSLSPEGVVNSYAALAIGLLRTGTKISLDMLGILLLYLQDEVGIGIKRGWALAEAHDVASKP